MTRLRLVKVLVKPVFLTEDDDGNLSEIEHPLVAVPAAEWPTYSSERFPRELAAWQRQLDDGRVNDSESVQVSDSESVQVNDSESVQVSDSESV